MPLVRDRSHVPNETQKQQDPCSLVGVGPSELHPIISSSMIKWLMKLPVPQIDISTNKTAVSVTYASKPQGRVRDFCLSLSELSKL